MKNLFIIITFIIMSFSSCKVYQGPIDLLGKWEKLEYGIVLDDGTEYLSKEANENCPNDFYSFYKQGKHTIATYEYIDSQCVKYPEDRNYEVDENKIIVNDEKYIYTIEDLTKDYLKLYLHKHEYNNTDAKVDKTIYVYTFKKSI